MEPALNGSAQEQQEATVQEPGKFWLRIKSMYSATDSSQTLEQGPWKMVESTSLEAMETQLDKPLQSA